MSTEQREPSQTKHSLLMTVVVSAIAGLVGGSFSNLLALPKNIDAFLDDAPKLIRRATDWWNTNTKISGVWTTDSEGDLEENACTAQEPRPPNEGNSRAVTEVRDTSQLPVAMDIKAYAGEVSGEIVSEGIKANYIFSRIEVAGSASGSQADVFVYDYIGGTKVAFAELQLGHTTIAGKDCLRARVLKQATEFLPQTFMMHRASRDISAGEYNERIRNQLLKAVKEWSKSSSGSNRKHRICEPNCGPQ